MLIQSAVIEDINFEVVASDLSGCLAEFVLEVDYEGVVATGERLINCALLKDIVVVNIEVGVEEREHVLFWCIGCACLRTWHVN